MVPLVPFHVKFDSPFKFVPDPPVMTRLSALFDIVADPEGPFGPFGPVGPLDSP